MGVLVEAHHNGHFQNLALQTVLNKFGFIILKTPHILGSFLFQISLGTLLYLSTTGLLMHNTFT